MGVTPPPPTDANRVPRARVVTGHQDWITPFVAHTTPLESWKLLIGAWMVTPAGIVTVEKVPTMFAPLMLEITVGARNVSATNGPV